MERTVTGDLNRIALFVRVAEAGGVTAAAKRMKLPKSSVSRNLTQLESELGVELVVRGTRRFRLTPSGQAFFEAVATQIEAVEVARDDVRKETRDPRGLVRILAPAPFARWVLAPLITKFVHRYPRVRIELSVGASDDPVKAGFDLAIVIGHLEDSSARIRSLGAVDCGLFASETYLRERGTPKKPVDLENHDCILLRRTKDDRWTLTSQKGSSSARVDGPIRVDDESAAISIAVANGGIVVLPLHFRATDPTAASLTRVLPEHILRGEAAKLVYAASRHVPSRISLVCDAILETATTRCPTVS